MKIVLGGVSCAAILAGLGSAAYAQTVQTTQNSQAQTEQTATEQSGQAAQTTQPATQPASQRAKVVVTGSLIATTPEDAPKPVEVYTSEDLENQGNLSVSDFVRSLTISTTAAGESIASSPIAGFANVNLRGQGFNGSMVLLNGRNLATTNGGSGADINTIPMEALEAVEVLKDGASATYGAGAVGGVINFRTRRDIDSTTVTLEQNFYDASDGEFKADILTGWVGANGQSNLMLSGSYFHQGRLKGNDRDWNTLPYEVNPDGYTTIATSPGRWQPGSAFYTTTSPFFAAGSIADFSSDGPTAVQQCEALGGENYGSLRVGNPASLTDSTYGKCAMLRANFEDLANEVDQYRFYGEFNADMSDTMQFHMEGLYSKREEDLRTFPANYNASGKGATDDGGNPFCASVACNAAVPFNIRTYDATGAVTGTYRNPFIDDFITRTTPGIASTRDVVYASSSWRPFGYYPSPLSGDGFKHNKTQRERYQLTVEVKGEFTEDSVFGFLDGVSYDYSLQGTQYGENFSQSGILTARLQNALLGYGGPNCRAVDNVPTDYSSPQAFNRTVGVQSDTAPGTNGCEWFNPFASSFETSILGGTNPQYGGAAYENSADLVSWMTHPRQFETQRQSLTFDALWSGELPQSMELPGGAVGWALGSQWRQTEYRGLPKGDTQIEEQFAVQACPFPDPAVETSYGPDSQAPGQYGCQGTSNYPYDGAFFGTVATPLQVGYTDAQGLSIFGEAQLPFTDRLQGSLAVRHEDYNSGKVTGDIYSVAAKYDITDELYVRASYGTNFRADDILNQEPGFSEITGTATFDLDVPAPGLPVQNVADIRRTVDRSLVPETSTTMNLGIGYDTYIGEGRFSAKADFFRIDRKEELATTSTATILNNVFGSSTIDLPSGGTVLDAAADCDARLIQFVTFRNGSCVQGVTTAFDVGLIDRITTNGPGFLTEGVDVEIDYSHPFLDGVIGFNLSVTQNLTYESTDFNVRGVLFEEGQDRLGSNNLGLSPPYPFSEGKGNATVRFANDRHRVNLRANYYSGYTDNRAEGIYDSFTSIGVDANGSIYSDYGATPEDYWDMDFTYFYSAPFWENLDIGLTVLNIFDEDPIGTQGAQAYWTGLGNPRGRQVKLSVKKEF